ncbi:MAG: thioredoxin domain-containing protein [Polyangiaceae bacterium]
MKSTRPILALSLVSLLVSCGGAAPSSSPSTAATPASSSDSSCRDLEKLVCDDAGASSSACNAMRTTASVLPAASCIAAMKQPEYVLARLNERAATCRRLADDLCAKVGASTKTCGMVRERTAEFDAARCQAMLDHFDEVVVELQAVENESLPLPLDEQKAIAAGDGPAFGPVDAKVTVVLFSDFECPYCKKAAVVASHLKAHFSDRIRFVFRQFPLEFHKRARRAAEAALIAHAAGKFWEFHDRMFENQEHLDPEALEGYARLVGIDPTRFRDSLARHEFDSKVALDLELGERAHVRGTPTLFINGKRAENATSVESVVAEIEAALAAPR